MIPFTITDSAIAHIKKQIDKEKNAVGFYLTVKKTGCSGFSWKPAIVLQAPNSCEKFLLENELTIFISEIAKKFISGITIDYCYDDTGIKQKRLVYINPNESGRCGCGESFTVD